MLGCTAFHMSIQLRKKWTLKIGKTSQVSAFMQFRHLQLTTHGHVKNYIKPRNESQEQTRHMHSQRQQSLSVCVQLNTFLGNEKFHNRISYLHGKVSSHVSEQQELVWRAWQQVCVVLLHVHTTR